MQIGLNTLSNIGFNYHIKLNEEEILIYEKETLRTKEKNDDKVSSEVPQEKQEAASSDKLSDDEKRLLRDLQARDGEVRAHEAAHQAAGGGMTGAASYTYQQGPDGKMYAIGGEVPISVPSGSTPQEKIKNARQAIAAAMAPANPSGQDFAVASSATAMLIKAQQKLAKETQENLMGQEIYQKNSLPEDFRKKELYQAVDISA